jgi:hypothetical protein
LTIYVSFYNRTVPPGNLFMVPLSSTSKIGGLAYNCPYVASLSAERVTYNCSNVDLTIFPAGEVYLEELSFTNSYSATIPSGVRLLTGSLCHPEHLDANAD